MKKWLCHVLTIKDVLDDGIYILVYFHKDSVTSCKKIKKDWDKKEQIKKDCDKKEELKKTVIKTIVTKKIAKKLHVSNKMIFF